TDDIMYEGLHAIVGTEGVLSDTARYAVGGQTPATVVAPQNEQEVAALIEYAAGHRLSFVIAGSGTHLTTLQPPEPYGWTLCTRRLNRVIDYSPADLVITLGAGMCLSEAQAVLHEYGQYLPWNPPLPDEATIGGIVASARSGSWRFRHGTPRDRLLALRAVRGDGIPFKSGAKVVKSVAGYDLHRLLCGSWGTLAVITEVTLKVAPLPSARRAVCWRAPSWDTVEPTLAQLMQAPLQPDSLDLVLFDLSNLSGESNSARLPLLLMEFSGSEVGVEWQIRWLQAQGFEIEPVLPDALTLLRDWFAPRQHRLLLKILMRSSEIADWMARLATMEGCALYAHAGSGILYVACATEEPALQVLQTLRDAPLKWYALQGLANTEWRVNRSHSPLAVRLKQVFDPFNLLPLPFAVAA
ncbi:MAG: FAD-binding oxidoreductase, partial [Fimbriimonadales bacterium]|nr:FAD-binding oxidoreductase [Fimbriimonadales bacterium]